MASEIFRPGLLDGQVVVVSGAGAGLGRATALELARLGATVVICGRRVGPLEETVSLAGGGAVEAVVCDIREEGQVAALMDGVLERHGRIDTLVNHAAATKAMIPQGGGKIVNVTLSPHHGLPGMTHSSAARAAVENMTRTLSIEWARYNIRLTAIAAGHFATETLMTKYPKVVSEGAARTVPLQRLGEPDEHAWLVAYLASKAGDYFSGAILTLDGARDNWFGPWPPPGLAEEGGKPPTEERRRAE